MSRSFVQSIALMGMNHSLTYGSTRIHVVVLISRWTRVKWAITDPNNTRNTHTHTHTHTQEEQQACHRPHQPFSSNQIRDATRFIAPINPGQTRGVTLFRSILIAFNLSDYPVLRRRFMRQAEAAWCCKSMRNCFTRSTGGSGLFVPAQF